MRFADALAVQVYAPDGSALQHGHGTWGVGATHNRRSLAQAAGVACDCANAYTGVFSLTGYKWMVLAPAFPDACPAPNIPITGISFSCCDLPFSNKANEKDKFCLSLLAIQASARQQCLLLQLPSRGYRLQQRCLEWLPWCLAMPVLL